MQLYITDGVHCIYVCTLAQELYKHRCSVAQNTIGNYDYIHTAYMHAHVTHTHTSSLSVFAYERYRPQSVKLLVVYHDNVSCTCMLNPCS